MEQADKNAVWDDAMTRVWPNVMTFAETLTRENWWHRLLRRTICKVFGCSPQPFIDRSTNQPMQQHGYCTRCLASMHRDQA